MLEVNLSVDRERVKMHKSGNTYAKRVHFHCCTIRRQQFTLHCSSIVYLQHGGDNYCTQNDVTVTDA